ncbi:putative glycolipid-binding domain-containing protein [Myxococcus sp. K15C18031901]|uniref:putative glycolipid-binding domain-containing protein n=1 Tax=Myxococcus dinghuensis TaxID=2906761 RepID=UPI0020A740EC|nr:putative glycolipid-binding domain-containing protein [Myxococcus dinghuensis]MCP3099727.1 putative glycolipid-binding domain-containing protein [Myxococcus dinghuensis]
MDFPWNGPAASSRLLRAWMWKRLDGEGSEYGELRATDTGHLLVGSVTLEDAGAPHLVTYAIHVDAAWRTRATRVELRRGDVRRSLDLRADEAGRWWSGAEEVTAFRGFVDVDLGFSPSTNTLPIRRLGLAVGQAESLTAAWVRMPDLALLPLPQRYTRLSQTRYRYESTTGSGFQAEVDVDALGLVLRYPPGWERVADTDR